MDTTAGHTPSKKAQIKMDLDVLAKLELADVLPNSEAAVTIEIDLKDLELRYQVHETFDDLIARKQHRSGLLYELLKLRLMLQESGSLRLINRYRGVIDPGYRLRVEMLLTKAGFHQFRISNRDGYQVIDAKRRPYLVEQHKHGLTLREIVNPDEIRQCHEFAQEIYYFKDYNYDIEVARQFDLNSDLFSMADKSGRIYSIVRCAARVPGYYCPFMYAIEEDGQHLTVPPEYVRFCEVMALFRDGKMGAVSFKRIVEFLFKFYYEVAHYDSFWTTYDVTDTYTGTYYKTRFMLSDYHKILTYRDFGGKWSLINTRRIKDLYDSRLRIFREPKLTE